MVRQVLAPRKMVIIAATLLMGIALLGGIGGLNAVGTSASGDHPFCLSDELLSQSLRQNPSLRRKMDDQEILIRNYLERRRNQRSQQSTTSNLIIPVVVYVVHNNGPENILDPQIKSQIAALNNAFTGSGVQFCLATQQNGVTLPGSTPGIIRIQNALLTNHLTSQESSLKALSTLPGDRYLRIWVVKDIDNNSGVAGYARFPGTVPLALEGIVIRYDVFGNVLDPNCGCPNLLTSNNQGKVLAHEVGHYLNLYHTFEGGCSGIFSSNCATDGDLVCDTPQIAVADTGCPTLGTVPSCVSGTTALTDNEMDYTNDVCRTSFTAGQQSRILAALNTLRPLLVSAQNLVYTGVQCTGGLNPAFSADNYNPCANQNVTFTALNNSGVTYAWDFGDTNSGSGNPATHSYSAAGTYTVTLTLTGGGNSVSSTQQVFVVACAPINSSQGNWYFGNQAGLNFSTGAPIANLNSSMSTNEGVVTQSDATGSLLFYSDSVNVYDKNHSLMNPTNPLNGNQSNTQSSISVPDPANQNRYYLFTLGPSDGSATQLWYTIVDFTSSSTGTLINVNTRVSSIGISLTEQITAVPKCNNSGHWIIVHRYNPSQFLVYALTSAGITGPSTSNAQPAIYGAIKASPDGTMLAQSTLTNNGGPFFASAALYDLDRSTGAIALRSQLPNGSYGCSFSPDSKLLYTSEYPPGFSSGLSPVYQYDLTVQNISTTAVLVASVPSGFGLGMQLGPDKRIYISSVSTFLPVINYPNMRDTALNPNACGYNFYGPSLQGQQTRYDLPNMIDALPPTQVPPDFSKFISSCSTVNFSAPACATSYAWNFGDSTTSTAQNPTHTYSSNGTKTVTLTLNGSTMVTHAVTIGLPISSANIFGPFQVCLASGSPPFYNYSANVQSGLTYNWTVTGGTISGISSGVNVDVVWNTLPGTVQLTVTDPATGCSTTKTLTVTQNCNPGQCVVPPAGMVDWWTFDETSGTTAQDLMGVFNNVGTHFNGPTPVAGIVDGALSFDGVNDYVEVPDHPELNFGTCILDVAEPMTIDLWVKTNLPATQQGSNSGLMTILDKRVNPNQPSGYSLFIYQGRLGFQMNGVNYVAPNTGPNYINIADNQWHFIAVSLPMCRGFGSAFLYVDGQTVLGVPHGPGFLNTARLNIGRRDPAFVPPNYFKGVLDELEIFKRALSGNDLHTIFAAGSRGKCKIDCSGNPSPCRTLPGRSTPRIRR
jgi:PKD repeat protein